MATQILEDEILLLLLENQSMHGEMHTRNLHNSLVEKGYSRPNVTLTLSELENNGLVQSRSQGQSTFFKLTHNGIVKATQMAKQSRTISSKLSNRMMSRCFKTGLLDCPKGITEFVPKQVFIGMPFTKPYEEMFEDEIEPILTKNNYVPWKADDNPNIIDLWCKICEGVQKSEFAIIDISDPNPNVHFELGISYGLGRKVILIENKKFRKSTATNLQGMELVLYSDEEDSGEETDFPDNLEKIILRVFN